VFEGSIFEAKARLLPGQGQTLLVETKVKAAVFEVNEVLTLRQQAD